MLSLPRRGILAAAAMLPLAAQADGLPGPENLDLIDEPAPDIHFTAPEGPQTLADYSGRPVLVNFWATWCVPCVAELPALDRLAGVMPRLAVLPLSSDRGGAPSVQRFYAQLRIDHLPTLLDPKGDAARAIGARGIPTTLLIGADGRTRARLEGAAQWDGAPLMGWINQHLM